MGKRETKGNQRRTDREAKLEGGNGRGRGRERERDYLLVSASPGLREGEWKNKGKDEWNLGGGFGLGFVGCSSILGFR